MTTFQDLQNGFYNALTAGLGLPTSTFQLLQPSTPLLAGSHADAFLWGYFNNIPPHSLTQNYVASSGNQFFSDYSGLLSALTGQTNNFTTTVGAPVEREWNAYLAHATFSNLSQLPAMFRSWAVTHGHMSVANKGASVLAAVLLDPVSAAQIAIMAYQGDPTASPPIPPRQPDWNAGYNEMLRELLSAPSRSFKTSSGSWNSNVSQTWSGGSNSGFFGLWGGSSSSSTLSQHFAASGVEVNASFKNLLTFSAVPGQWYNSSALGNAFSHKTGAPWGPGAQINWTNTFDPRQGDMARFAANLIVANQMRVTVRSFAKFSTQDQAVIHNNSGAGLWPFYTTNNSSGASTSATFSNDGELTVEINSQPRVPVILGVNVVPVDEFVGHAVEGAKLFAANFKL